MQHFFKLNSPKQAPAFLHSYLPPHSRSLQSAPTGNRCKSAFQPRAAQIIQGNGSSRSSEMLDYRFGLRTTAQTSYNAMSILSRCAVLEKVCYKSDSKILKFQELRAIAVASSTVTAQILEVEYTTHSALKIPIPVDSKTTYNIDINSQLAVHIKKLQSLSGTKLS